MTGSAFLTLYRSLTRHRLYAVLNIGGLALGIVVFLVLFLFVQFERGYDHALPGSDRLWVADTVTKFPGLPDMSDQSSTAGLLTQLRDDFPGLSGTRMIGGNDVAVRDGAAATSETIAEVDPDFFRFFPFPVAEGDLNTALARPDAAVVTTTAARKYLGSQSPIGKTITMTVDGREQAYRVTAVLDDMPADLTYKSDIFIGIPPATANDLQIVTTSLSLPDAGAAATLERKLPAFVDRHPNPSMGPKPSKFVTIRLRALRSLHLAEPRDRTVVASLGLVGVLTLLIASMNYINLATARAGLRAREVAVRKVLGATRKALVTQFLVEAVALVAVAALIGLALAEVALPFVNTIGGISLAIHYVGARSILVPIAILILVVGGLAGSYPAFALARFQPAAVLASVRNPIGSKAGAWLRQGLVIIQFAIAIAFTIGTTVLVAQTRHLRDADLGFERAGLILVSSLVSEGLDDAQRADLLRAFSGVTGITGVGRSRAAPTGGSFNISSWSGDKGGPPVAVQQVDAGPGFFQTYHARLLAGRLFDPAYALDDIGGAKAENHTTNPNNNLVINQAAVKTLGFASAADAIGKVAKLGSGRPTIIGVIDDMRFMTPREPIAPTLYSYNSRSLEMVASIRAAPENVPAVVARMAQAWHRIAPAVPFSAKTVNEMLYDKFYKADAQRSRLFTIGAVLAVLIGCIGLYGLASFDTARRVKEIGIRKTLGASTRDILKLLIGQFLRPVLIANLIAWPIAFFAMRSWLSGFDDRVALSPWFFIAASMLAIGIATLTVIGQAWRVARAEPARALRHE